MSHKGNSQTKLLAIAAVALTLVLAVLLGVLAWAITQNPDNPGLNTDPSTQAPTTEPTGTTTEPTEPPTTAPTQPPFHKVSSATITNTGDMLMHLPVIQSAYVSATKTYDFTPAFAYFKPYVERADYAVANLETTLAGTAYPYKGYPQFNCPDGIVSSLKEVGFDMLLTANNHSYDTYETGFFRTQQVLQDLGMDHLGTIASEDDTFWQLKDINGIKIGMVCYTYQTDDGTTSRKSLNGIKLSEKASKLISSYSYQQLDKFYAEMDATVTAMEAAGAEAVVLYIHWGDEYATKENATQRKIAQKMCDLGVDVIVGDHSHVVQPMDLLTSTENEADKTVVLYSTGNAISNQLRENMTNQKSGHTEDGVLFTFTFAKYSDGTVILESAEILPFWLNYRIVNGRPLYQLVPLDKSLEDWKTSFELTDFMLQRCNESYDRTMKIVGTGLVEVQEYLQQLVTETENQ